MLKVYTRAEAVFRMKLNLVVCATLDVRMEWRKFYQYHTVQGSGNQLIRF